MKENLNILIVDDDKVDRESIRRALNRPGKKLTFREAANAEEASGEIRGNEFDCIFLDYNMPDLDGISLLRRFYDVDTGLVPAPTVMLTGKGSESVMGDALRWGAQDYLIKDNISSDTLHIAMSKARETYELKKSQHQAMEVMRHSQKMEAVGQLASGIAHDFNNILMIILGNTRMQKHMLTQQGGADFQKDEFETRIAAIERAAGRGSDLVRRLMVFTRQCPPKNEAVDNFNDRIGETKDLLEKTLGANIKIQTILEKELWPVWLDMGLFDNALVNLAANARDAMPEGGSLTIETKNVDVDEDYVFRHPDMSCGPYVMVSVSDTGTGMSPDVMKHIFEPFYTTKATGSGMGIGLSMVYGMIKQSGGYIHVYSEIGHGSIFRIYLPKYEPGYRSAPMAIETFVQETNTTILIVDDNEQARTMGAAMLERLGYRVLQAESGRTAIEILKSEHDNITLIFTDIFLRDDMNGTELADKIGEIYPQIKVLFTSGYTEKAMREHYNLIENRPFIGKPYNKQDLSNKLKALLDPSETFSGNSYENADQNHRHRRSG